MSLSDILTDLRHPEAEPVRTKLHHRGGEGRC